MRYGTTNVEYVSSFFTREDDGPMWALNLMKYREVADYADGRESSISGQEADDRYSPIGPLRAIGARVVVHGPVVHQLRGDATIWDRVGIVQYPTRRALPEMNRRDDFKELHAHKDAGMDRTFVLATFPRDGQAAPDPSLSGTAGDHLLLVQVVGDAGADDLAAGIDATRVGCFEIENFIVGDGRTFGEARYDLIPRSTADALASTPAITDDPTAYAVIVDPAIDVLAHSLADPTRVVR